MDLLDICDELEHLAQLEDLALAKGLSSNKWAPSTFRRASEILQEHGNIPEDPASMDGIGAKTATVIQELSISDTSERITKWKELEIYRQFLPFHGIGPKRAIKLVDEKGYKVPSDYAEGLIRQTKRYPREWVKEHVVDPLTEWLEKFDVTACGSYRRKKDTIGDVDFVGLVETPEQRYSLVLRFKEFPGEKKMILNGEKKISYMLEVAGERIQVELVLVKKVNKGGALLYSTGSKNFNVDMREAAKKMGYHLDRYGLSKEDVLVASDSEEIIFQELGFSFVSPEKRRDGTVLKLIA